MQDILLDTAVSFATKWLKECIETHKSCAKLARHSSIFCTDNSHFIVDIDDSELLPLRLLNLNGVSDDTSGESLIYLVETAKLPRNLLYAALSHRWGNVETIKTENRNLHQLIHDGISLYQLPKTFREAIQVTRRLGFHYLWIDSLCILQDDPEDWNAEAVRMAIIFDKAVCTIAAVDAVDSDSGLLPHSDKDEDQHVRVLDSRAWACQENMISPRSILFTQNTVHWECRECDATIDRPSMRRRFNSEETVSNAIRHPKEIFAFFRDWRLPPNDVSSTSSEETPESDNQASQPDANQIGSTAEYDSESGAVVLNYDSKELPGHTANLKNYYMRNKFAHSDGRMQFYPDNDQSDPFGQFCKIVTTLDRPHEAYYPFITVWWEFLSQYTPRLLTYESDRFLAMNGITNVAQRWTHLRSTFGLWYHFLEREICWYIDDTQGPARRPTTWLGPSWSWMSTKDGRVCNDFYSKYLAQDAALQLKPEIVTPVGTSFDMPLPMEAWKPSQYHCMEAAGMLRPATVITTQDSQGQESRIITLDNEGRFSDHETHHFRPDCVDDFPIGSSVKGFVLHVWHFNAEFLHLPAYLDIHLFVKQIASTDEILELHLLTEDTSKESVMKEREVKRLGYVETTYGLGTKLPVKDIVGWWYWIRMV